MSKLRWINAAPIVLACWGMLVPAAEIRAEEAAKTTIKDVAISGAGVIRGIVVDGQGEPVDGAAVAIRSSEKVVAKTVTDDKGEFNVREMTSGVYEVIAPEGVGVYRFWTAKAAPPAAKERLTLVSDAEVLRGNCADGSCGLGGLFGGGGGGLFGHGGGGGGGLLGHGGGAYASPIVGGGGYWGNGVGGMVGDSIGSGFYGGGIADGGFGVADGGFFDGGFGNGGFVDGGFGNGGFVDGGFGNGGFVDGGFGNGGFVDGGFGGAHYCPPGTVPVYGSAPAIGGGGGLLGGLFGGGLLSTAAVIGGTVAISAAVADGLDDDDDDTPASP